MKKMYLFVLLLPFSVSYAADIDVDDDTNDAVDVDSGGTNGTTAAAAATNLGLGTGNSPQFASVNVGAATDTTLSRVAAGRISVEGSEIATKLNYTTASGNTSLTAAQCGGIIFMTGAGEVGFPDCAAALLGCDYQIKIQDAAEKVELVMEGDTTNDYFVKIDDVALDADDELDMAVTLPSQVTVMCISANRWQAMSQLGVHIDGGTAD